MNRLAATAFALLLAAVPATTAVADGADKPMVEVKLSEKGAERKRSLNSIPAQARKLFARYDALAARQAPLTLAVSDPKSRDFAWTLCKNERSNAIVFITHNHSDKPVSLTFSVPEKAPLFPTYRRVFSRDGGKTWQTIAFEPPHGSVTGCPQPLPRPYVVEVPPHSYQTATVRFVK